MITECVLATRASALARTQSNWVAARLREYDPRLMLRTRAFTTRGDQLLDQSLTTIGGKALFVKELEQALLRGEADFAVHSLKDVPHTLPDGLCLAAICKREDPADVLVSSATQLDLTRPCCLGSSSLRRQVQLQLRYPQVSFVSVRGNLQTRLEKLNAGIADALVLAAAGLKRSKMAARIRIRLPFSDCLPAAGQGALALECRTDDAHTRALLTVLNDPSTALCTTAERAVSHHLDGNCQTPLAAFAHYDRQRLYLRGFLANTDGSRPRWHVKSIALERIDAQASIAARELGSALGEHLADAGKV